MERDCQDDQLLQETKPRQRILKIHAGLQGFLAPKDPCQLKIIFYSVNSCSPPHLLIFKLSRVRLNQLQCCRPFIPRASLFKLREHQARDQRSGTSMCQVDSVPSDIFYTHTYHGHTTRKTKMSSLG